MSLMPEPAQPEVQSLLAEEPFVRALAQQLVTETWLRPGDYEVAAETDALCGSAKFTVAASGAALVQVPLR